jgi:hypothetical protein
MQFGNVQTHDARQQYRYARNGLIASSRRAATLSLNDDASGTERPAMPRDGIATKPTTLPLI